MMVYRVLRKLLMMSSLVLHLHNCTGASNGHASGNDESSGADAAGADKPNSNTDNNGHNSPLSGSLASGDCIVLAPCAAHELLPMNPEFPADTFTSCLTTPIPIALRWFIQQNMSMAGVVSYTVCNVLTIYLCTLYC
jgi:hypothetical protein